MPLDPRGLRIDTFNAGKYYQMKIWHEPSGCIVEGDTKEGESQLQLRKRLLQELSERVFLVNVKDES